VLNVRIAFDRLWPAAVSGELQKQQEYFGYDKWFQARLGEALVKKHTMRAKELLGSPRKRLRDGAAPHWIAKKPGPAPKVTGLLGLPSGHAHLHWKKVCGIRGPGRCELCSAISKQKGCLQVMEPANRQTWSRKRGQRVQKKQRLLPNGKPVPRTSFACGVCRVRLCKKGCSKKWDHETGCAPCDRQLVL
jgi:hypothetical protein